MNDELVKNLTALIDETISEIEDLKKSRYAAEEVEMGKKEHGKMAGHPTNGSIGKAEDDEEDEDEDDAKKAEGKNSEADPGTRGVTPPDEAAAPPKSNLHEEATKAEDDEDEDEDDEEAKKAEGKNSEADPGKRGVTPPDEASVPGKSNLHAEAKKSVEEADDLKKSLQETESLMKSYIDELAV
jgi:hypothetical protein